MGKEAASDNLVIARSITRYIRGWAPLCIQIRSLTHALPRAMRRYWDTLLSHHNHWIPRQDTEVLVLHSIMVSYSLMRAKSLEVHCSCIFVAAYADVPTL